MIANVLPLYMSGIEKSFQKRGYPLKKGYGIFRNPTRIATFTLTFQNNAYLALQVKGLLNIVKGNNNICIYSTTIQYIAIKIP